MAIHWIGAGANLLTGSDETRRDDLGYQLLFNEEALSVAAFTSQYPMQHRNPSGWGTPGANAAMQVQAWIAGPDASGTAIVVLANYGPDPCLKGGCNPTYGLDWGGDHLATAYLDDLGIGGGQKWNVRRVWGGGGRGGEDHADLGVADQNIESWLGPGESVLYRLQRV
jgi:alpha-galactosidase